jgi:hypothetical protein
MHLLKKKKKNNNNNSKEALTKNHFFLVAFYRHIFRSYIIRPATTVFLIYAKDI